MTRKTKQLIAAFHWILGLIILIPLLIAAISGTALIFREELETYFEPELYLVQPQKHPQPLDSLAAAVGHHTEVPISYLTLPSRPKRPFEFVLTDNSVVFVHPYTAEVLGHRHLYGGPAGWLYNLHSSLFTGRTGEVILGVMGMVIVLLFFSGITIWLWHKHPFRHKFRIKFSGSSRRTVFDLHKVAGILTGTLLALSAITGSGLIFYNTFSQATHALAKQPVPSYPVLSSNPDSTGTFSASRAAKVAQTAMPEAALKRIVWPTPRNRTAQVRFRQQSEIHPNGMSFVYIDSRGYNVVSVQKASSTRFPANLNHWLYPLHSGKWASWWNIILILTGMGGIFLVTTGFLNVRNMKC